MIIINDYRYLDDVYWLIVWLIVYDYDRDNNNDNKGYFTHSVSGAHVYILRVPV